MTGLDAVLWGETDEPRAHLGRFVRGFAAASLAGYALFALATRALPPASGAARLAYEGLFVTLTYLAPPAVAALSTYRRGGLLAALAVGVVPGLSFALIGTTLSLVGASAADAPAGVLGAAFAVFGVAGALAGYAAVALGRWALRRLRER